MRMNLCVAGLLSAAVLLSGCSSSTPKDQPVATTLSGLHTGLPVEPASAAAIGYVGQWATDLGLGKGQSITHVTVMEDLGLLMVAEEPVNMITAVSLREGKAVWRSVVGQNPETLFKPIAAGSDGVLINTEKRVYLLDAATGRTRTITNLGTTVADGPVLIHDYAIFGGRNGKVFAHDIKAGWAKWNYAMGASILGGPVVSGSNVFVADTKGVYAMLTPNGEQLWRNHTWGPVTAKPAAALDHVYIACRDRALYCLDRVMGDDQWVYRVTVPLTESPIPLGPYVFQPVEGQGLLAISAEDGKLLWTYPDMHARPISLADGKLFMQHGNRIELLDAANGRLLSTAPTVGLKTVRSGPEDSLLVITKAGQVMRLNPEK